jgi:hypothetical protein
MAGGVRDERTENEVLEAETKLEKRRKEQLLKRAASRNRMRRMPVESHIQWWRVGSVLIAVVAGLSLAGGIFGGAGAALGATAGALFVGFVAYVFFVDDWARKRSQS